MTSLAVVVEAPGRLSLQRLALAPPGDDDVIVDIDFSGISTGTERLLWTGKMPTFPGMGYPLVPGYESIGRIVEAGPLSNRHAGQFVFVPGARCFGQVRGLFGGAASRVVVPGGRTQPIGGELGERGVLLALAATAYNAIRTPEGDFRIPDLIVGHGVLGRLLARLAVALGTEPPVVWEIDPLRSKGAEGYRVVRPEKDDRTDYNAIYDVSGAAGLLDSLIARLAPGGEVVLAGFYNEPLEFAFPPAFIRRARLRVAAEWQDTDLAAVHRLVQDGHLSLDHLITTREGADHAQTAYETAFDDPECLKMILDWRAVQ
ncbi:MAG: chlorophyll synthesis pathway protein BchC [Gammaproteobacteria bacterium]|nr:chlorophyll synthesis pathway protein BchC [Gammaproteobacteria bacterium]